MFDKNCFFSRGAPAARQSGACIPGRQWAGGTPARATPAPGGQGGSGCAPERRARPRPPDTFFESTYPEMQTKHIPRVNEYQS